MFEPKRACRHRWGRLQQIGWAAGISLTACATFGANAQIADAPPRPKIIIAPTLKAQPSTLFELDIRIEGESALPQGTYLEIRGLPQLVTLSGGRALSRRSWSVPLEALANLKLQLPEHAFGKSDLDLRLVTKSYVVVAFATTRLIVAPAGAVTADPGTNTGTQASGSTPTVVKPKTEPKAEAERKAEVERKADAERKAEAERMAEAERKAEVERKADAERKAEAERMAEAERKAEVERKADAERMAEAERKAEVERKAEAERKAESTQKATSAEERPKQDPSSARTTAMAEAQEPKQATASQQSTHERKASPETHGAQSEQPARKVEETAPGPVAVNQSASSTAMQERRELAITAPPVQTDAARAQAERLIGRGDQYLAQGNIVVARQYYLRAADQSDARAALKLAETYDPNEIERFNVVGLAANPAEAKRWYQRAAALGAADAESKLQRLSAR